MKTNFRLICITCVFLFCVSTSQAAFSCLDNEIFGIVEDFRKKSSMSRAELNTLVDLYVECIDIAEYEPIVLLRNFIKVEVGLLFRRHVID
ncbi:MAG TPA: hypothetical protein DIU37_02335, partial [Opitutae bacterium]|nr:hypothetical protein [Opitutae bacterium]